jgi:hypothetical protein
MSTAAKIVGRHQRVAFMNVSTGEATASYQRMTNFTQMTNSKNPKEYTRQYVDRESEDTDVVGYAPSIGYSFDRHTNTPVHERIAAIHDGELIGSDALVDIVIVDLFSGTNGSYVARKRTYAVIPDADGDGTDALVYAGTFKSKSEIEEGTASLSDDGKTLTYTAPTK